VSFRVLELLARGCVPEEAREEVFERLEQGEKIGRDQAEEIVREHQSEEIARDHSSESKAKKKRKTCAARKRKAVADFQGNLVWHAQQSQSKAEAASNEWLASEPPERDVIEAVRETAAAWTKLADFLESVAIAQAEAEAG
jgi:hypothetical protein